MIDDVLTNIDTNLDAALERLFAVMRIKSISTDPAYAAECKANAEWHAADLKSIGFDAAVLNDHRATTQFEANAFSHIRAATFSGAAK